MCRVNFKPISMPADWLNFRFTPFQIHEHLYSRAEATSCLLITHWANNKHDPKTQETRRETENWKQETNKSQNSWLAFHLLGSRYVVRLMLVVCPPKRKSRQRNEISKILQRKSKLQVYSKFESFGPVQRLCNTFSVSPRVCVCVCHFRKWKSSAVRYFVWNWIWIWIPTHRRLQLKVNFFRPASDHHFRDSIFGVVFLAFGRLIHHYRSVARSFRLLEYTSHPSIGDLTGSKSERQLWRPRKLQNSSMACIG